MNPHYPAVKRRADGRCEYCRAPETVFNCHFEVDHIQPLARGGATLLPNLALACSGCNNRKRAFERASDFETGAIVRLFNPRVDRWADHFHVDAESGEVLGLTPTGRATVDRLDMNNPNQLTARAIWIQLRLFP